MTHLPPRTSLLVTSALAGNALLTALGALRARGPRDTALFFALGTLLPIAGEYQLIRGARLLRHHLQPQVKGLPVAVPLAWYAIIYNTFAALESLAVQYDLDERAQRLLLPLATALTATSMDLVADVAALEQGQWAWAVDGPYAPAIEGPNGRRGIPLANYGLWLALSGTISALFVVPGMRRTVPGRRRARASGRGAALRLLPLYLGAVAWELRQGRWRYVASSLLFPLVLLLALLGRPARP